MRRARSMVDLFAALPMLLGLSFVWGLGGGLFLNLGRTLFLEAAPESHRGRCLSVYTLALLGMAPIGTQTAGLVGEAVGPATGCLLAGVASTSLIVTFGQAQTIKPIATMCKSGADSVSRCLIGSEPRITTPTFAAQKMKKPMTSPVPPSAAQAGNRADRSR